MDSKHFLIAMPSHKLGVNKKGVRRKRLKTLFCTDFKTLWYKTAFYLFIWSMGRMPRGFEPNLVFEG